MKLIIQIPCYNEAETLAITMAALPRKLKDFETIEYLIINDGSTDETVAVAKKNGATHIVNHIKNKGLAETFISGLQASIKQGADIIVNTDADNQYCAEDIALLVQPILEKKADIVIGTRPINNIKHFSFVKKW